MSRDHGAARRGNLAVSTDHINGRTTIALVPQGLSGVGNNGKKEKKVENPSE